VNFSKCQTWATSPCFYPIQKNSIHCLLMNFDFIPLQNKSKFDGIINLASTLWGKPSFYSRTKHIEIQHHNVHNSGECLWNCNKTFDIFLQRNKKALTKAWLDKSSKMEKLDNNITMFFLGYIFQKSYKIF
jgi:hypothetical protein